MALWHPGVLQSRTRQRVLLEVVRWASLQLVLVLGQVLDGATRRSRDDTSRLPSSCTLSVTWWRPSEAMNSKAKEMTSTSRSASGGPERLQAELEVLAVTPVLGVLVAEGRGPVPGLPGRHRVVLHKGTHDGCRPLRAAGP